MKPTKIVGRCRRWRGRDGGLLRGVDARDARVAADAARRTAEREVRGEARRGVAVVVAGRRREEAAALHEAVAGPCTAVLPAPLRRGTFESRTPLDVLGVSAALPAVHWSAQAGTQDEGGEAAK